MHDPQYTSEVVHGFMAAQRNVAQLVIASSGTLTTEGVVTVLFHAATIADAVARHRGGSVCSVTMQDLDRAAKRAPNLEALARQEPNLASYIAGNLDEGPPGCNLKEARELLAYIASALSE